MTLPLLRFPLFLLALLLALPACKYRACPIDGCKVRTLHRHPSLIKPGTGGESFNPNNQAHVNSQAQGGPPGQGPFYRGVPWWKINKAPKVGEKYKPGYAYQLAKKGKVKGAKRRKRKEAREELLAQRNEATEGEGTLAEPRKETRKQRRQREREEANRPREVTEEGDPNVHPDSGVRMVEENESEKADLAAEEQLKAKKKKPKKKKKKGEPEPPVEPKPEPAQKDKGDGF